MTHDFKMRNGIKTCEICGRDAQGYCASSQTKGACSSAECPWKYPEQTPSAFRKRVAELEEKYALFNLWRI